MASLKTSAEGIEYLLQTVAASAEESATGGLWKALQIPKISVIRMGKGGSSRELQFPLSAKSAALIKEQGTKASVGANRREVLNPQVRDSYQLLPHQLEGIEDLTNQEAFQKLLEHIQVKLCIPEQLEAHFYKLLLYEKGSFFLRHRDHTRLPKMIGTLVLELPSIPYEGGALRVWQPYNEEEPVSFDTKSEQFMGFTAFFADCYHEATQILHGNRCVLVFSLTTTANRTMPPASSPICVPEHAAMMVKQIDEWSKEEFSTSYKNVKGERGKPVKMAIVLSHSYTRGVLTDGGETWASLSAFKGKDRAVVELVVAAAKRTTKFDAYIAVLQSSALQSEYRPLTFLQGRDLPDHRQQRDLFQWVTGGSAGLSIFSDEVIHLTGSKDALEGGPTGGSDYRRVAIVLWPKNHRDAVSQSIAVREQALRRSTVEYDSDSAWEDGCFDPYDFGTMDYEDY